MSIVHLTQEDYEDALELASFNTLDNDGIEIVVDLDETEAAQLQAEGVVDTTCARTGRDLTLLAPDYHPV